MHFIVRPAFGRTFSIAAEAQLAFKRGETFFHLTYREGKKKEEEITFRSIPIGSSVEIKLPAESTLFVKLF